MTREQFERLRGENGSEHVAREFTHDDESLRAFRQIERECENVSAFRMSDPERSHSGLVVIGEPQHAGELAHASRVMDRLSGRPATVPISALAELRVRRWERRIESAMRGTRTLDHQAHYGMGMRLPADGSLAPLRRPQG